MTSLLQNGRTDGRTKALVALKEIVAVVIMDVE